MCGIAGFFTLADKNNAELTKIVTHMSDTLASRGPDDKGAWIDEKSGIALGHQRLSIIDPSKAGCQPMCSSCGRYIITYNGEIYNFMIIRKELENLGHQFRSDTDTEVVLAAIEEWDLLNALQRFVGMFAFALWDKRDRVLSLVRDRLGIKPLYYGWVGDVFVFGSELKAIKAYPGFISEVDRNAIVLLLRHNYIPAPYSIYKGICKLLPGSMVSLPMEELVKKENSPKHLSITPRVYWSAKDVAEHGSANSFNGDEEDAIKQLDTLLRDAVKLRMVADVPLGALLSGGIDSSTVVALMQAQSKRPVKTFTIGFCEDDYNEAVYAKEIAEYLGTDHTEVYLSPREALEVIPDLPVFYDEPFSDVSQIPAFLVSKIAREHVTVALSGDGGDELFGGYNRYFWGKSLWEKTKWINPGIQNYGAFLLRSLSPETWDKMYGIISPLFPQKIRQKAFGDKLHKMAEVIGGKTPEEMYYRMVSFWKNPSRIVVDSIEPVTYVTDKKNWPELEDFTQRMMFLDMISYLPDDILTKIDRASMANSLEVRVPLLDHRLVEFAWQIPLSMKIKGKQGKWLLKQVLCRYIPGKLVERPKMGFGVPIDSWLRGPLRDWAEGLLDKSRLQNEGYFNCEPIRLKWEEHLSGKRNWQYYLWSILMFQAWLEKN